MCPLGKIDAGPAEPERVYVNGFAGRRVTGYAAEDGIVMDDGTTSRLGETEFFMTTTTAQAGKVMSHLEFLLQVVWPELRVTVASVSDQWAAMSMAGPKSRDVLKAAFPHVDVAPRRVMGVLDTDLTAGWHRCASSVVFPANGCGSAPPLWPTYLGAMLEANPEPAPRPGGAACASKRPGLARNGWPYHLDDISMGKWPASSPFLGDALRAFVYSSAGGNQPGGEPSNGAICSCGRCIVVTAVGISRPPLQKSGDRASPAASRPGPRRQGRRGVTGGGQLVRAWSTPDAW
jgi:hypothetical protein